MRENYEKDMRMMRGNYEGRIAALAEEEVNKQLLQSLVLKSTNSHIYK